MSTEFFRNGPLRAAVLTVLLLAGLPAAARIVCDVCGRNIRPGETCCRRNGRTYCRRDFEKTLPICSVCGKKCRGEYTVSNGKNFCSKNCFTKSLPKCSVCGRHTASWSGPEDGSYIACPKCAQMPHCFVCDLPTDYERLADGRSICRKCRAKAVTAPREAERIFRQTRARMQKKLGLSTGHRIAFSLVDRNKLHRLAEGESDTPRELGLFVHHVRSRTTERRDRRGRVLSRKTEKVEETFDIYALDCLTREYLEYVCAHELAHDWQAEHYPDIRDKAVREGFAEYVGWLYNRALGRHHINRRIEKNADPVYGGGFRMIKAIADREGFEGVCRFLNSKNR